MSSLSLSFGHEIRPAATVSLEEDWRRYIFQNPSELALSGSVKAKLGVNFVLASKATREIIVHRPRAPLGGDGDASVQLTVKQLLSDAGNYHVSSDSLGVGAVVWDAGDVLAQFMCSHPGLFAGKSFLDLGTGTGIAGIVAGIVGCSEIFLTDHESLRDLCMMNVRHAMEKLSDDEGATARLSRVEFEEYWWGGGLPEKIREKRSSEFFDIICASDDLYDSDAFPPLLSSLKSITKGDTLIVFSYKRRMDEREIPFFEQLSEAFRLAVVSLISHPCDPYTETYVILAGRRGGSVETLLQRGFI